MHVAAHGRFKMFLVSAMPAYQIGFGNTPEIPVAVESKCVL